MRLEHHLVGEPIVALEEIILLAVAWSDAHLNAVRITDVVFERQTNLLKPDGLEPDKHVSEPRS